MLGNSSSRTVGWLALSAFLGGALSSLLLIGLPALAQKASPPPSPQNVLVAEEFRLVDAQGRTRAKITPLSDEGLTLALYHRDGKHMTLYRLTPTGLPTITLSPLP